MFVKEFGQNLTSQELNTQLEGVYKWRLNLNEMSENDARNALDKFQNKIKTIKQSSLSHQAERNPQYMEALLVSKVLETWLREYNVMIVEQQMRQKEIARTNKYLQGIQKHLSTFESKYPGYGAAVMRATAARMAKRSNVDEAMNELRGVLYGTSTLMESEVDQASAIVAARGMVDEIQKMLEKIGAMVNEELPGLYDTIRDRVGADQAQAFNQSAQTALNPLMDAVKAAREAMDNAARTVAGEQPMPMDTGAAPVEPVAPAADLGAEEIPEPPSEFDTSDAATGGAEELGRAKRA